ncbi:hypothetical protein F4809DRAFT_55484 [Biscogniauxia mediterranea]|nr:hypothetical protein F4809DRAFT_55484 [Biscogniauxia mediterranea]
MTTTATTTPPIAIIGAGPCGLTLARLLECKGIDYVVYEREQRNEPNRAGGSLDIHAATGQRAIREAGLFEAFRKHARWEDEIFRAYGHDGVFRIALGDNGGGGHTKRDAPEIDRGALRSILLDSIPAEKIRWGRALAGVEMAGQQPGRPVLRFADGTTEGGFALVVGADGAWSKVRPLLTDAKPQYSGKTFIEARIDRDNPIYETAAAKIGFGTLACLGPSRQMVFQRQGDGAYRLYLAMVVPEAYTRDGSLDLSDTEGTRRALLADELFSTWSEEWKVFVRHAEAFRSWPLYTMPAEAMAWTSVPGLAVVGDAAHVAVPAGEGVNCAMTDALELANKIAECGVGDLDRAVREYEEGMFPRAVKLINDGLVVGHAMFHDNNPDEFMRAVREGMFGQTDDSADHGPNEKN